jgi:hypothetical protein
MPSIAQSTVAVPNTTVVQQDTTNTLAVSVPVLQAPIRSTLPPGEVLATVTAVGNAATGSTALWQTPTLTSAQVSQIATAASQSSSTNPVTGVPREVLRVAATQEPYKDSNGNIECLVSVTYVQYAADANFAGVQIWFTGYNGSSTPTLVATGAASPVTFVVPATGETVVVTVVAYGPSGATASFLNAPTTTLTLNASTSPPPPPTITQPTTALAGGIGWQFSWASISGLVSGEISGYWVYRSSTSITSVPPSDRINYVAQPATGIGVLTYQDLTSGTPYYWVSSVNTFGLESTLSPANITDMVVMDYPVAISGQATSASYDGNDATYSAITASDSPDTGDGTPSSVTNYGAWSGFTDSTGTVTAVVLKVLVAASVGENASAAITYSLDGGTTWLSLYGWSGEIDYPQQYVEVSLPTTQNLANLVVNATATATAATYDGSADYDGYLYGSSSELDVYEVRVEITEVV